MKTVEEYRQFAQDCWGMAARMNDPQDRKALELPAIAWEKVANERDAKLKGEEPQLPEPA
jgi:hypothetical protein